MMLQKEDNEEFLKKNVTPNIVFIIPFRDREEEYFLFIKKMDDLLVSLDKSTYQYLFVHQCDKREFCRGGLKNIGFLVVKNTYPDSYLDITLVFNDIDTYPSEIGLITDYSTKQGIVKHFYGYSFALGGIVSILYKIKEIQENTARNYLYFSRIQEGIRRCLDIVNFLKHLLMVTSLTEHIFFISVLLLFK